ALAPPQRWSEAASRGSLLTAAMRRCGLERRSRIPREWEARFALLLSWPATKLRHSKRDHGTGAPDSKPRARRLGHAVKRTMSLAAFLVRCPCACLTSTSSTAEEERTARFWPRS